VSIGVQLVRGLIERYDCCQGVAKDPGPTCDNWFMASAPMKITLREPGVAGSYELVERRGDGSLLLRPEHERLSDVLRETEGQVFRDDEFAAHLERVAASEDDLPVDLPA
jgi:hypothetical protein